MRMTERIDWDEFNDRYIRLVTGVEKKMELTNWTGGIWFERPGINFDVVREDGKKAEQKQFTATSRRLIRALKPILIRAEQEGRKTISVSILRTGEGQDTQYSVSEDRSNPGDPSSKGVSDA